MKEETPLFLAAREGSFQCAKILLEFNANRDITDHMDRLPRDIALERLHTDIVQLLDSFIPSTIHSIASPQSPKSTLKRTNKSSPCSRPPLPPPRNTQLTMSPPISSPTSHPPPTYEDALKRSHLTSHRLVPEAYLTPSPDSPSTWSSSASSPRDWLTNEPQQTQRTYNVTSQQQAVFI